MAIKSLEQLKAKYAEQEGGERTNLPNNYYRFWDMKEGERCVIRFLPDRNEDNPFGFLAQKVMHVLEINGERKSVPCLSMYGDDCPVCKVSQDFYKMKDDVNGKKYWKKKQYIAQVIVVEDPLPADPTTGEKHTGKLRFVALNYQLYQIIQEAFKSDDTLEAIPYNYEDGYDFVIKKSKQGQYATYTVGSKFSKQRALSEDELAVVEEHLADLSTLLPKHPGKEKVEAMLQAALSGDNYSEGDDFEEDEETRPAKPAAKPAPAKLTVVDDEEDQPAPAKPAKVTKPVTTSDESSEDIDEMLQMIRERRAAK